MQDKGFPSSDKVIEDNCVIGLTKREHFASLAMQSLISLSDNVELDYLKIVKTVSKASVIFADALLKELEK